ncbi:MAG: Na(+)-translocating NADH-quinone reductase subunit C [Planctomycetaceae bacterium]|nr:Na(+)-translocating NADH-quinone reductase subunit C [Planctomycetaceae bacterium]
MQRDSASFTLLVATVLCVACSVLVAGAAVALRPLQVANKRLDRQKNVLLAASLIERGKADSDTIKATFGESIERQLIDTTTGEPTTLEDAGLEENYDPRDATKKPELTVQIPAEEDVAGIKKKAKYAYVYKVLGEGGAVEQIVVPIYGKGLWSTVYGFLSVDADGETVRGVTFYEHGETPGLGGEVENPDWQASWVDKSIYGDAGEVELSVIKGSAGDGPDADYQIDGLSGATITSKGVSHMIDYWLGPHGFGPYLKSLGGEGAGTDG